MKWERGCEKVHVRVESLRSLNTLKSEIFGQFCPILRQRDSRDMRPYVTARLPVHSHIHWRTEISYTLLFLQARL